MERRLVNICILIVAYFQLWLLFPIHLLILTWRETTNIEISSLATQRFDYLSCRCRVSFQLSSGIDRQRLSSAGTLVSDTVAKCSQSIKRSIYMYVMHIELCWTVRVAESDLKWPSPAHLWNTRRWHLGLGRILQRHSILISITCSAHNSRAINRASANCWLRVALKTIYIKI